MNYFALFMAFLNQLIEQSKDTVDYNKASKDGWPRSLPLILSNRNNFKKLVGICYNNKTWNFSFYIWSSSSNPTFVNILRNFFSKNFLTFGEKSCFLRDNFWERVIILYMFNVCFCLVLSRLSLNYRCLFSFLINLWFLKYIINLVL